MNTKTPVKGQCLELSEHKNYLELTDLVCFYNSPNLNDFQLDCGDTEEERASALEYAQTLVNMPVYAYCTVNSKMEPTFTGHEAVKKPDGTVEFKTVPIGVHESVAIEDREVTLADGSGKAVLPCLVATQRIWTRNKNAAAAIKRLHAQGELYSSFELEVSEYHYNNGIRHGINYEFVGNTLLARDSVSRGKAVRPAYGSDAAVLSVAEAGFNDTELMLAEAIALDLQAQEGNEVNMLDEENKMQENAEEQVEEQVQEEVSEQVETPAEEEVSEQVEEVSEGQETEEAQEESEAQENSKEEASEEPEQETAELTSRDLRHKVHEAAHRQIGDCDLVYLFPERHVAWFQKWDMLETQFKQVEYTVNGNDVAVTGVHDVELEVPLFDLVETYAAQKEELSQAKQLIAELNEYKTKYEAAEQQKAEAEHAEKVSALKKFAEDSGLFTEEELAGQEIAEMIENLHETDLKALMADKMLAAKKVEVASVNEVAPKRNLENDETVDRAKAMKRWLGR